MTTTLKLKFAGAIAAAAMLAAAGQAQATSGTNVGVLDCVIAGGVGLILGSQHDVSCVFKPAGGGGHDTYHGKITKVGLDIGFTEKSYVTWVVFAPGKTNPGALAGDYVGATAEATVGAGLGANVLVGGFQKSITLQPLSVEAQAGLNLAAGVAELTLRHN